MDFETESKLSSPVPKFKNSIVAYLNNTIKHIFNQGLNGLCAGIGRW